MRHCGTGIAPADVGDPFAEHRTVDQSVVPHGETDVGAFERKVHDRVERDEGDLRSREGLDAVIGLPQQWILEVDQIALHVNRKNLSRSASNQFVAERETAEHQAGKIRPLALSNDILPRLDRADLIGKCEHHLAIGLAQRRPIVEFPDHRLQREVWRVAQWHGSWSGGSAEGLSFTGRRLRAGELEILAQTHESCYDEEQRELH